MAADRKEEAILYFGQEGFQRALTQIWKKYRSLGRAGGHAKLEALTQEECDAIGGFMGIGLKPGERCFLSLARFEQELAGTPFPCSAIPELHLLLTGELLLSDAELSRLKHDEWEAVFAPSALLLEEAPAKACWIQDWLNRLQRGETPGYRTLRELCRDESAQTAAAALREVVRALMAIGEGVRGIGDVPAIAEASGGGAGSDALGAIAEASGEWSCGGALGVMPEASDGSPGGEVLRAMFEVNEGLPPRCHLEGFGHILLDRVRLPVLAARITGDSHAFDLKQPTGRLLWLSLRERLSYERSGNQWSAVSDDDVPNELDTQAIRDVYRACGIGDDDLSSLVYTCVPNSREAIQPAVLTLRQVERLPEEKLTFSQVFVVENPSVFSTLLDITTQLQEKIATAQQASAPQPVLICTSGQPSLASLLYMKGCLDASGETCRIRYSGDFDAKGIEMGIQLARRFQDKFEPWRFDTATYELYAHRGPLLNETDVNWLMCSQTPWDVALIPAVATAGRKCFQETFVAELVRDWITALMEQWKS